MPSVCCFARRKDLHNNHYHYRHHHLHSCFKRVIKYLTSSFSISQAKKKIVAVSSSLCAQLQLIIWSSTSLRQLSCIPTLYHLTISSDYAMTVQQQWEESSRSCRRLLTRIASSKSCANRRYPSFKVDTENPDNMHQNCTRALTSI